ncbi:hypothetical protein LUZ60_001494 [Juncus effusus]|nr:hypothetical protein LUZ60_001494 [Juncus effusus]
MEVEMEATDRVEVLDLTIESRSTENFTSMIESKNRPAVFRGGVKSWKAISEWNPFDGGLDYLLERVGSDAVVEAMMSNHAQVFYGDLRSHERVAIQFSSFIASCKSWLEQLDSKVENLKERSNSDEICLDAPDKLYLAQVPIYNSEKDLQEEKCVLQTLRQDIDTPSILGKRCISSINFWMNRAKSRSSIHYDPHHNMLCIVSGHKEVTLWAPSASRFLYPMPVYGEASNHSAVNIENPTKEMKDYSDKVTLNPGDILFIPEGWYHQVDSEDLTIGVNFWWESKITFDMLPHMDAYYLRRILNRLVSKEMNTMLLNIAPSKNGQNSQTTEESSKEPNSSNETKTDTNGEKKMLSELDTNALQLLQELISLVHSNVNSSQETDENYQNAPVSTDDNLARIFISVKPSVLRKILLAMVFSKNFGSFNFAYIRACFCRSTYS